MEPETLKPGDGAGNRMVAKYTSPRGVVVYGIGVPQAWETPLGPTWSYVIEGDNLTLVDTGCYGSVKDLEEGLEIVGYPLNAVDRVIVTHGHMDHDGNCFDVVKKSGAQLWAHEVYDSLIGVNRWEREAGAGNRLQDERARGDSDFVDRFMQYTRAARNLKVDRVITDGYASDGFTFYYTPGHSPDELCILYEGLLFSGDHILPQITPHPSVSRSYAQFRDVLPEGYRSGNRYYGLAVYLKSLKRAGHLSKEASVLPAHRAFHNGKFNLVGLERAWEILEHHRTRCSELIDLIRRGSDDLESITRNHFSNHQLEGVSYYLAHTEVMSHLEFLQQNEDIEMVGKEGKMVQWNGTDNFSGAIDRL